MPVYAMSFRNWVDLLDCRAWDLLELRFQVTRRAIQQSVTVKNVLIEQSQMEMWLLQY